MKNKKLIIGLIVFILLIGAVSAVYFVFPEIGSKISRTIDLRQDKPKIVEENLVIPETKKITASESKIVEKGAVEVPLVPKTEGEKVVVAKAVLTIKGGYNLAFPEAGKWATDAKLAFIKSLGAVTLEGKSSQWQLAFVSKSKPKKGYEIIIQADQIVSKKEIDSNAIGADVPKKWLDSNEAIKTLQEMPQYSNVSISAINFFYNTDAKEWRYGFSTSIGSASVRLY